MITNVWACPSASSGSGYSLQSFLPQKEGQKRIFTAIPHATTKKQHLCKTKTRDGLTFSCHYIFMFIKKKLQ
ncbi:hypothetical protein B0A58_12490 [Flavobacterium branchiophilum NBRC 15030 = ATCC 35035]|nr:hypothetical protein B0A58_12490 [Flavobacterium branchiophilum NBRC 15030 = ATCC 35035]